MKEQVSRLVEKKVIAIVGTRRVTAYGREVTESLTGQLAAAGLTIVSGLALGVDGVAHQAAITAGGKTVAVLGAGVEVIYPPAHRDLYGSILSHGGAIVSEVAPEKHVGRGIFPARNRIIAGLSQAVLVTEGAIDSGSLITARAALDYGRPVLAVPGPINSAMAEGTNYLIKQGAKLVTGVEDILEELGYKNYNGYKDYKNYKKEPPVGETGEEQKILDLLFAEPREFDDLVRESQIPAGKLGAILAVMEMKKKLKNSGLTYSL
jgi:DNA processing protein